MLTITIIATVVAAISAVIAGLALKQAHDSAADSTRSADAAEQSVIEARRSADAAERSAGAAVITAAADRAADHRERQPALLIEVDKPAAHDGDRVIYRITNQGPVDLDSITVHRPQLGDVEGRTIHQVAATGAGDWVDAADLGPVPMGTYGRFTLSLGPGRTLPTFRVKVVSCAGEDDAWSEVFVLDHPRLPPPPQVALPVRLRPRTDRLGGF